MTDIVGKGDNDIVKIIKRGGLSDIRPFDEDIYLIDAHIAGTSYVDNIEDIESDIKRGMDLRFVREASNPFDERAILVKDNQDRKLGYVPRSKNEILSRLMDAGKLVFGKVHDKEWVNDWLKVTIEIFLRD